MQTFLNTVVQDLLTKSDSFSNHTIILPSKRAGVFLKDEFKKCLHKTVILPRIISIEDFIEALSNLNSIDNTSLIFEFYKVYLEITPKNRIETFDTFCNWATIVLNDFNEIDRHLVDAKNLFDYLKELGIPGVGVFQYISFRAGLAIILSLVITTHFGKRLIQFLKRMEIGEIVRDLNLAGQNKKMGTPTMGGIIIVLAIVVPTLLLAKLDNVYIILMLVTTLWLAFIGFFDDYIKVYKKNKDGLHGKFKIIGQITLGLFVGLTLWQNSSVVVRLNMSETSKEANEPKFYHNKNDSSLILYSEDCKSTKTTIPFFKNNEFDYAYFVSFLGTKYNWLKWIVFILAVIFIITAVSNGANLTDGVDGLATGISAIIGVTLAVLAYVSGNIVFAEYLNIMYIPNTGELVVFISTFIGATIGFLWYNSYPAQVFMGDTGSLTLGGVIAVFAIVIRKELMIPVICGIFVMENLSVILQTGYFKYTKKKYGQGKRIFKMAPLHHHFQRLGYAEPKIVTRFWIVGIILALFSVITLKLR